MTGWVDYDTHARRLPRDDLWGQVRRTVRGQAVAPEQIDMIVAMVVERLQLGPGDALLDVACGNGALTSRLQPYCGSSLGTDLSPYLVGVAEEMFAGGSHRFAAIDAVGTAEAGPTGFTKALCYGSLAYLTDTDVRRTLNGLARRCPALRRVLLGNLPDPAQAGSFYGAVWPDLDQPCSDIGVWRGPDRIAELAGPAWQVSTSVMPPAFFAAHYRFDALLVRA